MHDSKDCLAIKCVHGLDPKLVVKHRWVIVMCADDQWIAAVPVHGGIIRRQVLADQPMAGYGVNCNYLMQIQRYESEIMTETKINKVILPRYIYLHVHLIITSR